MDRRKFLKHSAAMTAVPAIPFSISVADAAGPITPSSEESGYKALVCVFLNGGNDSHNTVVPYLGAEYTAYNTARRSSTSAPNGLAVNNGLALPQSALDTATQRLGTTGLALHPAMTRLGGLFNSNKLAIVANCGPLLDETTLTQYRTTGHPLPPQLFSHSDMQMHWQSMIPDQPADTGWGGRLGDMFRLSAAGRLPVGIGLSRSGVFLKGDVSVGYSVNPINYSNGAISLSSPIAQIPTAAVGSAGSMSTQQVFIDNFMAARPNLLEQQYAKAARNSLEVGQFVLDSMYTKNGSSYTLKNNPNGALDAVHWSRPDPVTLAPTFPNSLAAELHSVAAMIAARSALGARRQIFFVQLGGFDNHGDQFGSVNGEKSLLAGNHFDLLKDLDEALAQFYDATVKMGVADMVTTMTMSDFGRTMKSNSQGSDHGWGGHCFVLGGKVKGGKILGAQKAGNADTGSFPWPSQYTANELDVGQGRLIPTISADAYSATLARWLGANSTEIAQIFPNLSRFNVQSLDLMNA
jgi:uncharacterized protein (DUF1501 family)